MQMIKKKSKNNYKRKTQNGGVGFTKDVSACRIGGLPEVVPTSDCPPGSGPGSLDFAKALYGENLSMRQNGGSKRRRGGSCSKKNRSNRKRSCRNNNKSKLSRKKTHKRK